MIIKFIILLIIILILYKFIVKETFTIEYKLNKDVENHDKWINDYVNFYENKRIDIKVFTEKLIKQINNKPKNKILINVFLKDISYKNLQIFFIDKYNILEAPVKNEVLNDKFNFILITKIIEYFYNNYLNKISVFELKKYSELFEIIKSYFKVNLNYYNNIIKNLALDDSIIDKEQCIYDKLTNNKNNNCKNIKIQPNNHTNNKVYIDRLQIDKIKSKYYIRKNNFFYVSENFIKILLKLKNIKLKTKNSIKCQSVWNGFNWENKLNNNCELNITQNDIILNNIDLTLYYENITKIFNNIIDKIYFQLLKKKIKNKEKTNIIENDLPCILYDASLCPLNRCKNNINKNICIPKTIENNNKIGTNSHDGCTALSIYGEEMCNSTINKDGKQCIYNSLTSKCNKEYINNEDIKCNEIDVSKTKNIQQCINHEENGTKCEFKRITYKSNNQTNICYNPENLLEHQIELLNSNNACTSKSEKDCADAPHCKFNNTKCEPKKEISKNEETSSCYLYDNSIWKSNKDLKSSNELLNIDNEQILEDMCNSKQKCQFLKYPSYFSNKNFTKCISKKELENIKKQKNISNILNNRNLVSNYGYNVCSNYSDETSNTMCIDLNKKKCSDNIYKNVCDNKANCVWNSTNFSDINNSNGYCMNHSLKNINDIKEIVDFNNKQIIHKNNNINQINKIEKYLEDLHNN